MGHFFKILSAIAVLSSLGQAQVPNVQFKSMKGQSYDLYTLLSQGKYVFVEMMFNG